MKKIFYLGLIILMIISCKKESNPLRGEVTFSGVQSSNGTATINGQRVPLQQPTPIKKGDVLKMDDIGDDIIHSPVYLYPTSGGTPILVRAGYTEEGHTAGYIIINEGNQVSIVAQYEGDGDTHLTYTVK